MSLDDIDPNKKVNNSSFPNRPVRRRKSRNPEKLALPIRALTLDKEDQFFIDDFNNDIDLSTNSLEKQRFVEDFNQNQDIEKGSENPENPEPRKAPFRKYSFRILARTSLRCGRWRRGVSPSLRTSQSCPQDVGAVDKNFGASDEANPSSIFVNNLHSLTAKGMDDSKVNTEVDSVAKRQTALTLEVGGIRCVVVSPSPVSEVMESNSAYNEDDGFQVEGHSNSPSRRPLITRGNSFTGGRRRSLLGKVLLPHAAPSKSGGKERAVRISKMRNRRRNRLDEEDQFAENNDGFDDTKDQVKAQHDTESLQLNDSKKTRNGGSSSRLNNHRMSLLGKPLNYKPSSRRDVKYRKLQAKLYNFLERPTGKKAALYHVLVFLMVFLCLSLSVVSTIENHEHEKLIETLLFQLEIVIVIWFGIEFLIRLWSSGCRSRYQGCVGRLRFMKSPFCIIDVITVVASIVVLSAPGSQMFAASALRGLRFFQILRMVRMDRRGGTWKLLGSVVYAHRQELITTIYIGFLGLVFSSFVIYLVEKDDNDQFKSFADALWWGVITLCTVGYGDAVPKSWKGKLIASGCALLGISFFALPAGILGSGFALKVQQQQRQKHMIRRRVPAATLIQCLWRCYAADENSCSDATWKIHMIPQRSPPPFKNNTSFVTRFNTLRRGRSTIHSPAGHSTSNKLQPSDGASTENLNSTSGGGGGGGGEMTRDGSETRLAKKGSDDEEEHLQPITLTRQHKGAIRAIRKLKYLVARKKFKEALKPYDVKDVIESYSAGHADLVNKVKGLQTRLDQILGRQGSKAKDVYDSKQSLASRVVKTERQVDDIEDKLDRFIQMYEEDRKRFATLSFGSPLCPPCSPMPSSPSPPYSAFQAQLPINHPGMGCTVPSIKPRPILVDTSEASATPSGTLTPQDSLVGQQALPKRPMIKKRVTLSSIPAEYILAAPGTSSLATHSTSITSVNMNLPSVRIEGCTPPSDSSFEGDLDQYGARCSIDSTNILEYRTSDLDSSSLNEQDSEPSMPAHTHGQYQQPMYSTSSAAPVVGSTVSAITTSSGSTEIVVTPVALQGHHHPHLAHHHRQYRQHRHVHHAQHHVGTQRVIPRVTVIEPVRATSTGNIGNLDDDEEEDAHHPSVRRVTSSPVPKSFMRDIP